MVAGLLISRKVYRFSLNKSKYKRHAIERENEEEIRREGFITPPKSVAIGQNDYTQLRAGNVRTSRFRRLNYHTIDDNKPHVRRNQMQSDRFFNLIKTADAVLFGFPQRWTS